jgi:hypothetical protein
MAPTFTITLRWICQNIFGSEQVRYLAQIRRRLTQTSLEPLDCDLHTRLGDRLDYVIESAVLEGFDRIAIERTDEHDVDSTAEALRDLQPVHPGHVDVQKQDIGGQTLSHPGVSTWSWPLDEALQPLGPTNITQTVSVDRTGNHYSGHSTLTQYVYDGTNVTDADPTKVALVIQGSVTATRITAD